MVAAAGVVAARGTAAAARARPAAAAARVARAARVPRVVGEAGAAVAAAAPRTMRHSYPRSRDRAQIPIGQRGRRLRQCVAARSP